jgi:hypothetical protein
MVSSVDKLVGELAMGRDFFILTLALLHEGIAVACDITQHTFKSLLLRGLTLFAVARGITAHLT